MKKLSIPILGQGDPNRPRDVHLVGRYALGVDWTDGHGSIYPFEHLRQACPCALCAGEGNMPGVVTLETIFTPEQTTMERVKWIGRYALAPIWADGHDTGLFTYLKLRELCQCDEHRAAREDANP